MITKEQVADLRPGDVVELTSGDYTIRGPLVGMGGAALSVHVWTVRDEIGDPYRGNEPNRALTVVSRAPRPLYVNHDRAGPVPGDVVRDADSDDPKVWFVLDDSGIHGSPWASWGAPDYDAGITWDWFSRDELPARLRLLVDGETGQAVTA